MDPLVLVGILALAIVVLAVLRGRSGGGEVEGDCICQKIRDLYGVGDQQASFRQLVGQVQQGSEEAARQLFHLAAPLLNHRSCWVARGDYELKAAFCSVWPGVEARASELGWE